MSKYSLLKTHLLTNTYGLKKAEDKKEEKELPPLKKSPTLGNVPLMTGAGGAIGAGLGALGGAGLLALLAPKEKRTLRNYLFAGGLGGLAGTGLGIYGGRSLGNEFRIINEIVDSGGDGTVQKQIEIEKELADKAMNAGKQEKPATK